MNRLEILLDYLKEDPEDPFTRFALASEYLKAGQKENALQTFEALLKDRPDYVGTYYHLAGLYRSMGRPEEAGATYQAGIRESARQGDRHSESELRAALMDLEIEG